MQKQQPLALVPASLPTWTAADSIPSELRFRHPASTSTSCLSNTLGQETAQCSSAPRPSGFFLVTFFLGSHPTAHPSAHLPVSFGRAALAPTAAVFPLPPPPPQVHILFFLCEHPHLMS